MIIERFINDKFEENVEETLQYKSCNFRKTNFGGWRAGIYRINDSSSLERIALIRDYKSNKGAWRVYLVGLTNSELKMKDDLMLNAVYGNMFLDYLF